MHKGYNELLLETVNAVRASGDIILDHWKKPSNISFKGRIDLVTETDIAVEKDLKQRLSKVFSKANFLAEETAGDAELGEWTWVIDPVDGTTNFAHRLPFVGTSVALWHRNRPVVAVVNAPMLGECFSAAENEGAFLNGYSINTTDTDNLEQALVATGFPYVLDGRVDEITKWLSRMLTRTRGVRRCGAASIDFAYVAAGRFDAFYEMHLKPWDMAAGWLLVTEAGGRVTNLDTNGKFTLYDRAVLASNGKVHDAVHSILTEE